MIAWNQDPLLPFALFLTFVMILFGIRERKLPNSIVKALVVCINDRTASSIILQYEY